MIIALQSSQMAAIHRLSIHNFPHLLQLTLGSSVGTAARGMFRSSSQLPAQDSIPSILICISSDYDNQCQSCHLVRARTTPDVICRLLLLY
jgi:hypothetical protein